MQMVYHFIFILFMKGFCYVLGHTFYTFHNAHFTVALAGLHSLYFLNKENNLTFITEVKNSCPFPEQKIKKLKH